MVEGARLESVYTGNRIKGSNPLVSADFCLVYYLIGVMCGKKERSVTHPYIRFLRYNDQNRVYGIIRKGRSSLGFPSLKFF